MYPNFVIRVRVFSVEQGFTFNRLRMKLFKTGSTDVVQDCQSCFAIDLPSCDLKRRQDKFTLRYISINSGCFLPILQQVVILDQVFAVIVVAVYVATSLVNRDDP